MITYPCNTRSFAEDWYLTGDKKIGFGLGECLAFDANRVAIRQDCNAPMTPSWAVTGEELKVASTSAFLKEKDAPSATINASAIVLEACNAADQVSAGSLAIIDGADAPV